MYIKSLTANLVLGDDSLETLEAWNELCQHVWIDLTNDSILTENAFIISRKDLGKIIEGAIKEKKFITITNPAGDKIFRIKGDKINV